MHNGSEHPKRLPQAALIILLSASLPGCSATDEFSLNLNVNTPPERSFSWPAQPGASAYQIGVSLDRGFSSPVGQSGFISGTQLPLSGIAWHEGHPVPGRPYFWSVRAYDRPDPAGLLLTSSDPREVRFNAQPNSWATQVPLPQPSPHAPPASPVPSPTP